MEGGSFPPRFISCFLLLGLVWLELKKIYDFFFGFLTTN